MTYDLLRKKLNSKILTLLSFPSFFLRGSCYITIYRFCYRIYNCSRMNYFSNSFSKFWCNFRRAYKKIYFYLSEPFSSLLLNFDSLPERCLFYTVYLFNRLSTKEVSQFVCIFFLCTNFERNLKFEFWFSCFFFGNVLCSYCMRLIESGLYCINKHLSKILNCMHAASYHRINLTLSREIGYNKNGC